jgi:hypothetical protein
MKWLYHHFLCSNANNTWTNLWCIGLLASDHKSDDLPKQTILEHLWMLIFSSPTKKKGGTKRKMENPYYLKIIMVDCESISSSSL